MKKDIKIKPDKINLSGIFLFVIVLNFFWGFWSELSVSDTIYTVSAVGLLAWMLISTFMSGQLRARSETVLVYACLLLWILAMFFVYNSVMKTYTVSFLSITMDSHARIMIYYAIILVPGLILKENFKFKTGSFFKFFVAVVVLSNLIFTVYAVAAFPDAVRARVTAEYLGYEDVLFALPSYSMIYAMSMLLPWFLMKWKKGIGFDKLYYLGISICLITTIVLSQFATALIAMLVGVAVYYVLSSRDKPIRALLVVVVLVVFFAVGMENWGQMLIDWSWDIEGAWGEKLYEIGEFLRGSEATGDLGTRMDLYTESLDSFFQSPLLGMLAEGKMPIGGHATLLDMLALIGLFGTLPFIVLLAISIKKMLKISKDSTYRAAIWGTVSIFLTLLILKNIITAIAILFTFLVVIPILFNSEAQNELNKKAGI